MFLSRACAALNIDDTSMRGRGDFLRLKTATVAHRGELGTSYRNPQLAFWSHFSAKLFEMRTSLRRRAGARGAVP
eukprot:2000220-Pyramimonas_sp.AAC.1